MMVCGGMDLQKVLEDHHEVSSSNVTCVSCFPRLGVVPIAPRLTRLHFKL